MSNESIKNKLVNSMKMTKAGTAKTTEASEKTDSEPKPASKKPAAKKKTPAKSSTTAFSSGCRVWPD